MEMILGAMVMALLVKAVPAALVDTVTMLRAATAGEWGLIDKERARKHARAEGRRQAMSQAWSQTRARRHRKAGGDGNYRPGMRAYLGDVYHGFWEDALEKRTVRRAGRPPNRYDRAVQEKVQRQRQTHGLLGRVGRALWEPVGEKRQEPAAADPWAGADDPTVEMGLPDDSAQPHTTTPAKEEPVTQRLVDHVPATPASAPTDRSEATDAAEAATHRAFERPAQDDDKQATRGHLSPSPQVPSLSDQQRIRNELYGKCAYRTVREGFADEWCDNPYDGNGPYCREHTTNAAPAGSGDSNTNTGGTTVNTATGDVHDVETCKSECEALADDLVRVDTALDVVDEAIRSAAAAVERIEAWLQAKNADACVTGMAAALDALSADNIKELIDKVAAAKQGVQDTIDNLAPLEEAAELVGSTDGSALNGR